MFNNDITASGFASNQLARRWVVPVPSWTEE